MKFFFKCSEAFTFAEVQAKLSAVEGVLSVAKLPGADPSAEEGLVEVETPEAGEAAVEAMGTVGAEFIPQPSGSEEAKESKAASKSNRGEKKDKSVAKDFFDAVPKLTETRQRKAQENLEKHRRQEAAMNKNTKKDGRGRQQGGGKQQQGGARSRSRSQGGGNKNRTRSGGRGGRGGYNRSNSRGGGGRGAAGGRGRGRGRGFHMPQFIEGHIASINNVPISMTNDQIADLFNDCGVIYDIARYENLAMVYFDCQESVLNAIVKVNGSKKMNGNMVCVSDGGVLRVPIPHHLNPQALSPQAIRMQQQGLMPPLQNPLVGGGGLPPHLQQQGGAPQQQQQSQPAVPAQ